MPLPRLKSSPTLRKPFDTSGQSWMDELLEGMEGAWCMGGEVLNLPDWRTIKYKETDEDIIILATPTVEPAAPCECGTPPVKSQRWGFAAPSYLRDLPVRCKRARIYFRQQRYRCGGCAKTFQLPLPCVDERRALTLRLAEYIEREAFNIFRTFSDIADEVGVSEKSVRDAFTADAERREKARRISTPEWLAIDEVYLGTGEHCVVSDPLGQRVLELLPDNRQETLSKWLLQIPDRRSVKMVTIDMWLPYKGAVCEVLSQARIVVDRYHVHNLLNTALKDVLQVVRAGMKPSEQRKYMRDPRLLFKSRFHLSGNEETPGQKQVLEKWFEEVPDVGRAYHLKEALSDILQLKDRRKAEGELCVWLERVSDFVKDFSSKHRKNLRPGEPFSNVLITVTRWQAQILNYVDFKDHFKEIARVKVSNAFAELANRHIKTAYRLGSGYSYEIIRAKVVHGGILVKRRPSHPLDGKSSRMAPSRVLRRGKKKKSGINLDANVLRLEKAREERDETKGLMLNPHDNKGWVERFGAADQLKFGFARNEQEERGKKRKRRGRNGPRQQPDASPRLTRHRLKINHDQIKMF